MNTKNIFSICLLNCMVICQAMEPQGKHISKTNIDKRISATIKILGGLSALGVGAILYSQEKNDVANKFIEVGLMGLGVASLMGSTVDCIPNNYPGIKSLGKASTYVPAILGGIPFAIGTFSKIGYYVFVSFNGDNPFHIGAAALAGIGGPGLITGIVIDQFNVKKEKENK